MRYGAPPTRSRRVDQLRGREPCSWLRSGPSAAQGASYERAAANDLVYAGEYIRADRYIVSKGPRHEDIELAPNMAGAEFLPQTSVLPLCSLVITHGGRRTTVFARPPASSSKQPRSEHKPGAR